jgi:hypothetical protein
MSEVCSRRGWHRDVDDVEPVIQILPEGSLRDHLAQVAVGRPDHADVDVPSLVGANALQLAGFQKPQQQYSMPRCRKCEVVLDVRQSRRRRSAPKARTSSRHRG